MYVLKIYDEDGSYRLACFTPWGWDACLMRCEVFQSEERARNIAIKHFSKAFDYKIQPLGD